MTLYTGNGDNGTTTTFGCNQRMSKSSAIAEALGTLDEANSFLGMCKVQSHKSEFVLKGESVAEMVHNIQNDLFTVQAELAGAPKAVGESRVKWLEEIIKDIEQELPEIKSFFISGGTELASRFDFARTLARRAERRVVGVHDEGVQSVSEHTLAYLNRLSSALYAFARLANKHMSVVEDAPDYK